MIKLDGSHLEGGGALVRVALALSAITGQEFNVTTIRAGREQGGLKAQHLQAITTLKQLCHAETNDITLGSSELWFKPGKINSGIYNIDIGTAGSITLLLQALILPALFAPKKVTFNIKGGTCGKWQASVDYLSQVLVPQLQRFVEKIEVKVLKRGYYPAGGGEIKIEIHPRFRLTDFPTLNDWQRELQGKVAKINLMHQGTLEQIRGLVNLSLELEEKEVGERIKMAAIQALKEYQVPVSIRIEYGKTLSVGGEVVLWAIFGEQGKVDSDNPVILGSNALIEKGKRSEDIGKEAAEKLKEQIRTGAAVDAHLADQLIPFMGLLPGSEIQVSDVTKHTLANIYVVEQFLNVKFTVEGRKVGVNLL